MVAQHRWQFADDITAIRSDITHHALIAAAIVGDVDACDAMLLEEGQERGLEARFDVADCRDMLCDLGLDTGLNRSEEHTPELPSLMRISCAGFCFKNNQHHNQQEQPI